MTCAALSSRACEGSRPRDVILSEARDLAVQMSSRACEGSRPPDVILSEARDLGWALRSLVVPPRDDTATLRSLVVPPRDDNPELIPRLATSHQDDRVNP